MKPDKKNEQGWHEDADPTCLNESGKPVARRHHEVATREKLKSTLRTPLTAPLKHRGRDEDREELSDEIVNEVQDRRKDSAVAKDKVKTADKVGDKKDAKDLVEWVKNPNKSDLKGVDTEGED